jgi:hypothetical protein
MIEKKKVTKTLDLKLVKENADKQAGSNNFCVTVASSDWRIPNQTVKMTLRDARALRGFLDKNLD